MEKYLDSTLSPEERTEDLLSKMSLEEKMGQVVGCYPRFAGDEACLNGYPQGAGQVSGLEMRSLKTKEEAVAFQTGIQKLIMERSEHHIPAIFHMEGLCGAYIPGATSFPSGVGRASSFDPELEEQVGEVTGRQERALGITNTLAPVLDISRDSRMGRQGETYGEDPALASALGSAYVRGVQQESNGLKTDAVAKHFLGFHASTGGIHGVDCELTERTLEEIYGRPFQAAITESGLKGIMPCYCSINGEPVSVSRKIMTGLLRERMGFEGCTLSDYCAVQNIHETQRLFESKAEAGLASMKAGMDQEVHFKSCFDEEMMRWFADGTADVEIINEAVRRVLTAKFRMGLFEHPFALQGDELIAVFHHPSDEDISLRSAQESLVLLKNDGVLPVSRNIRKIAVVGKQASTARIFYGGYTHFSMAEGMEAAIATMAGVQTEKGAVTAPVECIPGTPIQKDDNPVFEEVLKRQNPGVKSLLEEIRSFVPETEVVYAEGYTYAGDDCSGFEEALAAAKEADLVIAVLGGKHGTSSIASMGEGIDAADINLPFCQEEFLKELGKLGKPVVGVHFNGRPISSDAADQYCNAILEAWNPAEKGGEAIVRTLFGVYNPSGKMPLTVARTSGQIPIYYNHPNNSSYHQGGSIAFNDYIDMPHAPRYYFGHGLSYTAFAYSKLQLSKKEFAPEEEICFEVKIRNVGDVAGTEVVQAYVRDIYACMIRPVKELAGFARVTLEPGEEKTVRFAMKPGQMAFLNRDMEWLIEKGEFELQVGSSSEDIRLKDAFRIMESKVIDGRNRGFYARAEVF